MSCQWLYPRAVDTSTTEPDASAPANPLTPLDALVCINDNRNHCLSWNGHSVDIIAATYPIGVKAPEGFKETMAIVFDDLLPKWNYRALPQRLES
jgi:hypothetical protein